MTTGDGRPQRCYPAGVPGCLRVLLAALSLTACGGGAAAPKQPVIISDATLSDADQPQDDALGTQPALPAGDLEACVLGLRDADDAGRTEGRSLYDDGLSAERAGDFMTARKRYFELIQSAPSSSLVPLAYLAFAELFRVEAESDPSKLPLASAAYREVVRYPPPGNAAYAYAWLRSGDVRTTDDATSALNDYKKALEAGAQHPGAPCAAHVAADATQKLVTVYADVGQPSKAHAFFRAVAGDAAAPSMVETLVETYRRQHKHSEACAAARATSSPRLDELARSVCP